MAPAELEAVLLFHPSIVDSAVIGIADERSGELPRAYVVLKHGHHITEQQIQDFVSGKCFQMFYTVVSPQLAHLFFPCLTRGRFEK